MKTIRELFENYAANNDADLVSTMLQFMDHIEIDAYEVKDFLNKLDEELTFAEEDIDENEEDEILGGDHRF